MTLNNNQVEMFHRQMIALSTEAKRQEQLTNDNISRTNLIIKSSLIIGGIFIVCIMLYIYLFGQAVEKSIDAMDLIQGEIKELRMTAENMTEKMDDMGGHITHMYSINEHVKNIVIETQAMNKKIVILSGQIQQLGTDSSSLHQNTDYVEQQLGQINQSMGKIANSLQHVSKPIKQFIPMP